MHGGATALILDVCTSLALVMIWREGFWENLGVSRTLNVTYVKPVREGEEVEVVAEIVAVGKRMCVIRGTMRRVRREREGEGEGEVEGGEVLASCEHGKVYTDATVKL